MRMPANRLSVACRATWRGGELANERGDKLARLPGAGGEPGWLGRRRPGLEPLRTPACRQERPDDGAAARQGGRGGVAVQGDTWRLAAVGQRPGRVWGETRWLGRTCVPNARSARAP